MSDSYFSRQFKNGEDILEIVRPHAVASMLRFAVAALFVLLPFFFLFTLAGFGLQGFAIFGILLLFGGMLFARAALMWQRNGVIIARDRIVDVEQRGLLHKVVSDAPYSKVEDVRYEQRGLGAMLFRYGTVVVEMQGSSPNLEIRYARDPKRIHEMIERLIDDRPDELENAEGEEDDDVHPEKYEHSES